MSAAALCENVGEVAKRNELALHTRHRPAPEACGQSMPDAGFAERFFEVVLLGAKDERDPASGRALPPFDTALRCSAAKAPQSLRLAPIEFGLGESER